MIALGATYGLCGRAAAALLRLPLPEGPGHHLAVAKAKAEAHALTGSAAGIFCGVGYGLRRFVLHEGIHIADDAHAGTLVDHLLDLFGRRDRRDDEVHEFQALPAEIVGDAGL